MTHVLLGVPTDWMTSLWTLVPGMGPGHFWIAPTEIWKFPPPSDFQKMVDIDIYYPLVI